MKRSIRISTLIAVLVVILLAAQAALAGDNGKKKPLDPDANACFDGGTLAGKCDTEDMWHAGWYLIRVEQGDMAAEDVPAKYGRILIKFAPDYNWCLDDDMGGQNGSDDSYNGDDNGDDPHSGDEPCDDDPHSGDEPCDDDYQQDDPAEENCLD